MKKTNELEIVKNPSIFLKSNIILYGAGSSCDKFLDEIEGLELKIVKICDKNIELKGKIKRGIEIINVMDLEKVASEENAIIIITSSFYNEIFKDLSDLKINCDIYTDYSVILSIQLNIENDIFPKTFQEMYQKNMVLKKVEMQERMNYYINHDYYINYWTKFIWQNPVMVYQVGKVGSTSLARSINQYSIPVIQPHVLAFRPEYMDESYAQVYHIFREKMRTTAEIKIISIVRDPIARDLAHLFQHIDRSPLGGLYEELNGDLCASINKIIQKNILDFECSDENKSNSPWNIHQRKRFCGKKGAIFQWYKDEMEEITGVNIFEHPFDREKGYQIIRKDNIHILMLKLESMENLQEVIGNFIGIDNFELTRYNDSKNKGYNYLYKEVVNHINLSQEYIDLYYQSEYIRHFYTEEEIQNFRKKWSR